MYSLIRISVLVAMGRQKLASHFHFKFPSLRFISCFFFSVYKPFFVLFELYIFPPFGELIFFLMFTLHFYVFFLFFSDLFIIHRFIYFTFIVR